MKPKAFHPWSYQYNKAYERGRKNKWDYLRFWAKDHNLSLQAQFKLEWIIFYCTAGEKCAKYTADHFGISRKTFHKWLGRFDERNLKTLEEHSQAPKIKRGWMVTLEEEERIISLRKKNLEFGKKNW